MVKCLKCGKEYEEHGLNVLKPCPHCGATLQEQMAIVDRKTDKCRGLLKRLVATCNGKYIYDGEGHSALCPFREKGQDCETCSLYGFLKLMKEDA